MTDPKLTRVMTALTAAIAACQEAGPDFDSISDRLLIVKKNVVAIAAIIRRPETSRAQR